MHQNPNAFYDPNQFTPEFRQEFDKAPLALERAWCCCVVAEGTPGEADFKPFDNRSLLLVSDGEARLQWSAPAIRSLFRGNAQPPVFGAYPDTKYDCAFLMIENHVLEICGAFGDRTDREMKEIFAAMRKRPDGKSLGPFHDHIWRGAALLLSTFIVSQAEYEAILLRLEQSCRNFEASPSSRNYLNAVRQTLKDGAYE